jgi:hypothetical protein
MEHWLHLDHADQCLALRRQWSFVRQFTASHRHFVIIAYVYSPLLFPVRSSFVTFSPRIDPIRMTTFGQTWYWFCRSNEYRDLTTKYAYNSWACQAYSLDGSLICRRMVRTLRRFDLGIWDYSRGRDSSGHLVLACGGIYRRGMAVPIEWVNCKALGGRAGWGCWCWRLFPASRFQWLAIFARDQVWSTTFLDHPGTTLDELHMDFPSRETFFLDLFWLIHNNPDFRLRVIGADYTF